MSLALALYRLGTGLFEPFAPMVLEGRAKKGKEDRARIGERLGRASVARPDGKLVWLHGVSVGETVSLLPLIERIRAERPDISMLVTSGTVTSAELLARRLPPGVIHQYIPVDGPRAVAKFMDHWRPGLGILCESDLWPNLIRAADETGAKLALVSARLTASSAKGWAKRPTAARDLLRRFEVILPQDAETVDRLRHFCVAPGPILNLKLNGSPLPYDAEELERLRTYTKGRPVMLAASTHPGEDEMIAGFAPCEFFTIIAPRHPDRGTAITTAFRDVGDEVAQRSAGDPLVGWVEMYVADTLGEMGLFMRLADIVVLGGSFVPDIGGHNPLEPARLGKPIVSGPYVHKNAELFAAMVRDNALLMVEPSDLARELRRLLDDKAARDALGASALAFAQRQTGAFEEGWALIRALLPA